MTEDYVSFETAKLLKEKGFDEPCLSHYEVSDKQQYISDSEVKNSDFELEKGKCISAPTLQMAMKWLREVHNLFIELQCYGCEANEKAHFEYSYVIREYLIYDNEICETVGLKHKHGKSRLNSYEEACEAAIKYCLENLI